MNWLGFSLLSAFFAALTAILAKIGVTGVDSNVATAIRTIPIIIFAWGLVFFQGTWKQAGSISSYSLLFLILSGLATAASWLFYFRALQVGHASQVSPIDKLSLVITIVLAVLILKEKLTLLTIAGSILMTAGAILIALSK